MSRVSLTAALLLSTVLGINFQREQHVKADAATAAAYVAVVAPKQDEQPVGELGMRTESAAEQFPVERAGTFFERPVEQKAAPVVELVKPNTVPVITTSTRGICRSGVCGRVRTVLRRIVSRFTFRRR